MTDSHMKTAAKHSTTPQRSESKPLNAEQRRLGVSVPFETAWKKWGPYLSERQWGTVREDYSAARQRVGLLPARSRAQPRVSLGRGRHRRLRDHEQRLCLALALWNGRDPILKERLFGLTNSEGNHGEDVKELYYYLDATPTHSYLKMLYKYPQRAFPYADLVEENRRRGIGAARVRAHRHGRIRRQPLLRRVRRIRAGRRRTTC